MKVKLIREYDDKNLVVSLNKFEKWYFILKSGLQRVLPEREVLFTLQLPQSLGVFLVLAQSLSNRPRFLRSQVQRKLLFILVRFSHTRPYFLINHSQVFRDLLSHQLSSNNLPRFCLVLKPCPRPPSPSAASAAPPLTSLDPCSTHPQLGFAIWKPEISKT